MIESILGLFSGLQGTLLAFLAGIGALLGFQLKRASNRAEKAETEARQERLRAVALEEKRVTQDRARKAAADVKPEDEPDPAKRDGLSSRW